MKYKVLQVNCNNYFVNRKVRQLKFYYVWFTKHLWHVWRWSNRLFKRHAIQLGFGQFFFISVPERWVNWIIVKLIHLPDPEATMTIDIAYVIRPSFCISTSQNLERCENNVYYCGSDRVDHWWIISCLFIELQHEIGCRCLVPGCGLSPRTSHQIKANPL